MLIKVQFSPWPTSWIHDRATSITLSLHSAKPVQSPLQSPLHCAKAGGVQDPAKFQLKNVDTVSRENQHSNREGSLRVLRLTQPLIPSPTPHVAISPAHREHAATEVPPVPLNYSLQVILRARIPVKAPATHTCKEQTALHLGHYYHYCCIPRLTQAYSCASPALCHHNSRSCAAAASMDSVYRSSKDGTAVSDPWHAMSPAKCSRLPGEPLSPSAQAAQYARVLRSNWCRSNAPFSVAGGTTAASFIVPIWRAPADGASRESHVQLHGRPCRASSAA